MRRTMWTGKSSTSKTRFPPAVSAAPASAGPAAAPMSTAGFRFHIRAEARAIERSRSRLVPHSGEDRWGWPRAKDAEDATERGSVLLSSERLGSLPGDEAE